MKRGSERLQKNPRSSEKVYHHKDAEIIVSRFLIT